MQKKVHSTFLLPLLIPSLRLVLRKPCVVLYTARFESRRVVRFDWRQDEDDIWYAREMAEPFVYRKLNYQ